jgi:hypothetical protein
LRKGITKMATQKKQRDEQRKHIESVIPPLMKASSELKAQQQTLDLLQSVSKGLYEEVDKLAKKSPADQISSLVLGQVNDLIRESKELASNDPFMRRYNEFVSAGDNPEHRDVVVILRQIRQGLDRFTEELTSKRKRTSELLSDAKGIRMGLIIIGEGNENASVRHLQANQTTISDYWRTDDIYPNLNLSLLDRTNIASYFTVPE